MALEALAADITGSATVDASLTAFLEADITGSAVVDASLTAFLEADITGSAVVTGNLNPLLRSTQQTVEVLQSDTIRRITSFTVKVLRENLIPPLEAAITCTATVTANLVEEKELLVPWGGITGTATITAYLDKNVQHTSSSITFTQAAAPFNEVSGVTLTDLDHTVVVELVSNVSVSSDLDLVQELELDATKIKSVETELENLQHLLVAKRVLPEKGTNNTLVLTQATDWSRPADSVLYLTQDVDGEVYFVPGIASSTLSLVSTASAVAKENLAVNIVGTATLEGTLTQDLNKSVSNTIDFKQQALSIVLATKKYVILQAPFNFLQTSIVLPSPLWGDGENLVSTMTLRRSMNGKTVTYVKTNSNRRLTYTFRILDRLKALELYEFVKYYNSEELRLTNWKGEVWKVNFINNPFDFVKTGRSNPGGDRTDISLEFEGEKLYG